MAAPLAATAAPLATPQARRARGRILELSRQGRADQAFLEGLSSELRQVASAASRSEANPPRCIRFESRPPTRYRYAHSGSPSRPVLFSRISCPCCDAIHPVKGLSALVIPMVTWRDAREEWVVDIYSRLLGDRIIFL